MQIRNLDNKVFVVDEFVPERDFKLVETFTRHLVLPYTQRSSGWSSEIILDSKKVKMGRAFLDAKPAPLAIFEAALRKVRKMPWPEGRSLSLLVYEWQHGSYIPLHDDHCVHFAVTYYLNSTWNPNWGHTMTKSPSTSVATAGYVCDCAVELLTWNWSPTGAPFAS